MKKASPYVVLIGVVIAAVIFLYNGENLLADWNPDEPYQPRVVPSDLPVSTLHYLPNQVVGDQLVAHQYYTVSYSHYHKNPEWVAYELLGKRLEQPQQHNRASFKDDPQVPKAAPRQVYTNTGYDRGHLVPAHDMAFDKRAMEESFYMSNICPQMPDFNRGIWKRLEHQVRIWARQERRLYVVTGPLLRERVPYSARLGATGPSIPRRFFKVVLDYDGNDTKGIAFIITNEAIDEPLGNFVTSIDRVEAYTGLDFFPNLSSQEEKHLEGSADIERWH